MSVEGRASSVEGGAKYGSGHSKYRYIRCTMPGDYSELFTATDRDWPIGWAQLMIYWRTIYFSVRNMFAT